MSARSSVARDQAASFRQGRHLGAAPIADLVTILDDVPNVHVVIEPAVEGDHHGMRATDPQRGVTILGAVATPHAVRLRSTLAHELGHHLFNDPTPAVWSDRTPEEDRATEFARHLLVPVEGLVDLFGQPGTATVAEPDLSKIVERFGVSPRMAAIQLREAGFIDPSTADRFAGQTTRALATRYGWLSLYRQWSTDAQAVRPPRRILAAAINAYLDRAATIATVANIHGVTPDALKKELDVAGITPSPADCHEATHLQRAEVDWRALDEWAPGDEHHAR